MRALLPYIPILIAVGLTIFTVIDIALIDRSRVKGLPKLLWILICIVLVVIGPVLWFLLGRERLIDASRAGGSFGPRPRRGPVAPDDDPEFLGKLNRESAQEQRIRDLEERLREIDEDDDDKPKE
jgi:hypothetical protein